MSNIRYANLEWLNLPDCSGLTENGKCAYFDAAACQGTHCAYLNHGMAQVFARLGSLDEQQQEHISQKYYSGKRPWTGFPAKAGR